jgi:hypothetical protein
MADPVIPGRFGLTKLQPVQGALARQRGAIRPACREFPRQHRQNRIVPELIVVGEVLVAECDTKYALHHHRPDAVFHQCGRPPISKTGREALA